MLASTGSNPERRRALNTKKAVAVSAHSIPDVCSCHHDETDHRSSGRCRMRDSYGEPCGCWAFERDAFWSGDEVDDDRRDEPIEIDIHDGPHLREPHEKATGPDEE